MKRLPVLALLASLLAIVYAACTGTQPLTRSPSATPAPTPTPFTLTVDIRTVVGDKGLPNDIGPVLLAMHPAVKLGDNLTGIDAVLISNSMLMKARKDSSLKAKLQEVARTTVLLVCGGNLKDVRDILELGNPTMTTVTTRYVVVGVRSRPDKIIAGGVLVGKTSSAENLLKDIEEYILKVQSQ